MKMSVCISCGNEIAENVKFCVHCGAPIEIAGSAVEEAQEEAEPAPVATEFIPKPLFEEKQREPVFEPVVITPAPAREAPKAAPAAEYTAPAVPDKDADKPGKKSKWGVISTWGYIGIDLLMAIPVVGFILAIVWACGGCRKYAKRNYARSRLIFMLVGIVLLVAAALIIRFAFPELIVWVFELLYPGYTIVF